MRATNTLTLALAVALLSACGRPSRYEFIELHMGVAVRIVLYAPHEDSARQAARAAFDRIAELEEVLSDWRPGSEVRRLTGRPGAAVMTSPELATVLVRALELAEQTGGAFDPTVGPLTVLWREARRTGRAPAAEALAAARRRTGFGHVRRVGADSVLVMRADMRLDLGGIAKGYVLDRALEVLQARGLGSALIEAGGDIVAGDAPPGAVGWHVDVPGASGEVARRAAGLVNAAVSTSGDAEQFVVLGGVRYSHVLDPRTGVPLTSGVRAIVIAPDGLTADGLATALTVLAPAERAPLLARYPAAVADVTRLSTLP